MSSTREQFRSFLWCGKFSARRDCVGGLPVESHWIFCSGMKRDNITTWTSLFSIVMQSLSEKL